jgi:error-prone DNA polymerase
MAMIAAGFTGGQAEELRRAFGFKRSEARMKDVEIKLREGMNARGIIGATQDQIIQSITSFALYGFPESHAASFALIAYASAYLKCHYLPAFMAAMLNNQPMGFYQPATLVKDAQRHGLKCRPIDATRSNWECTLEPIATGGFAMRVGLRYVRGLREETGREIVRQRGIAPLESIDDLARRVPKIQKAELTSLAEVGALNFVSGQRGFHRRDALWQVERAARRTGPLLESTPALGSVGSTNAPETAAPVSPAPSPLLPMTDDERVVADYHGTGLTVGPHPMSYRRAYLNQQGIRMAKDLMNLPHGMPVRVAGAVIARQRPGTAKGFVFLSLEDETGIANIIITPQLFEQDHTAVIHHPFLLIAGRLQHQENVISVKAEKVEPLVISQAEVASHDFH